MDEDLDLNHPGKLPDGTAESQKPCAPVDATAAELKRGYKLHPVEKTSHWDDEILPGTEQVGDKYSFGGFLGRQEGTAR